MPKKLPRKENHKSVNVSPVSQVEQELAVSRALSALCGGSGVGQAPEPPHSAQSQVAESIKADRISLQASAERSRSAPEPPSIFLPVAPQIRSQVPRFQEEFPIPNSLPAMLRIAMQAGKFPREKSNFRQVTRNFLTLVSIILILTSITGFGFTFGPILQAEINYKFKNQISRSQDPKKVISKLQAPARNASHSEAGGQNSKKNNMPLILPITAVNEVNAINFPASSSIVIPKIDASAEFFVNTDASNYDEYISVLQKGIAHAKGTALPGEVGNSYFFAHSAGNLFDVARFNAVFYLISNLEKGDSIYVSFGNQKFKYTVYDKKEVDPTDTEYLNNRKDNGRMLTLQTCTPPGTDWRRLLVFARIEE